MKSIEMVQGLLIDIINEYHNEISDEIIEAISAIVAELEVQIDEMYISNSL